MPITYPNQESPTTSNGNLDPNFLSTQQGQQGDITQSQSTLALQQIKGVAGIIESLIDGTAVAQSKTQQLDNNSTGGNTSNKLVPSWYEWSYAGDESESMPFWADSPTDWENCIVDGQLMPGVTTIEVTKHNKVDVRTAPGMIGAYTVFMGYQPADVVLTTQLWCKAHLNGWFNNILKIVSPKPFIGGSYNRDILGRAILKPINIQHAMTTVHGITRIIVKELSGPRLIQNGIYEIKLNCIEYFPPPKMMVKVAPVETLEEPKRLSGKSAMVTPPGGTLNTQRLATPSDFGAPAKSPSATVGAGPLVIGYSNVFDDPASITALKAGPKYP